MSCIRSGLLGLVLIVWGSTVAQAGHNEEPGVQPSRQTRTVEVRLLEMSGPLTEARAEVSGLTWRDNDLIVLPQNPELFAHDDMLGFFVISKSEILSRLSAENPSALKPKTVLCQATGMRRIISGFDGLEAMGIMQDRVYMTVEAKEDTVMAGYLICGHYNMRDNQVTMDMTRLTSIPMGVNIPNVAEESMIIDGEQVITFSEANGKNITDKPLAKVFDKSINFIGTIPFPNIEYRVTDATGLDAKKRFWVINYFYPGEREKLKPAADPEMEKFGIPGDWVEGGCVERLLELELTDDRRIVRTETPPIYLELRKDGRCRNWEAVVRLDDQGFLLMTDKYPGTLFAFVANPYQH
ncbi:MAG: hypothetical protein GY780_06235 [bacterium]|nr:hypothetical protein [bacterium]